MYAIFETGGKQYKVAAGDEIEVERLSEKAGGSVTFDRVLMIHSGDSLRIGTPRVEAASVLAEVISHRRGVKLTIFKMKRRKGYHLTKGHRQELSLIKIKAINS